MCLFTTIFSHSVSRSHSSFSIYLATWNHKSKQSTERKKYCTVISRTRTANKNDMLVLRLYHFHSIFEISILQNAQPYNSICLLFIEYFVYNTQYSFRFINDTKNIRALLTSCAALWFSEFKFPAYSALQYIQYIYNTYRALSVRKARAVCTVRTTFQFYVMSRLIFGV